jgi:hypothetical protein
MVSISPYFLILGIPLLAAVAGALSHGAPRAHRWALGGSALVGIAFAVLAATTHEPGVPIQGAVFGVATVGVVVGALPPFLFFVLGRALGEHRLVLGLVCVAAAVPLVYFHLLGWILTLAMVHCPPDAYECPF